MKTTLVTLALATMAALSGCSSFREPNEVTVMRWCDGGRNAVLMAVNSRVGGQRAMVKHDWTKDDGGFVTVVGDKPVARGRNWGWDHDPVGEQWAATVWVYNLPPEKFLHRDAREIETEYVSYCNRVNAGIDLP